MQTAMNFFPQPGRRCHDRADGEPVGSLFYPADVFQEAIQRETARSLRSGRPFLLVLIEVAEQGSGESLTIMAQKIASVLSSSTREIDVKGWYAEGAVLGVLFSEFGCMRDSVDDARAAIVGRLYNRLSALIGDEGVRLTPYTLSAGRSGETVMSRLY